MTTTENVDQVLKAPWWETVKNEVARTITVRIKAEQAIDKPHGSVLGEMFVQGMNQDRAVRAFVQYLLTRAWGEIVDDLRGGLSPQVRKTLLNGEGHDWFSEFRIFLSRAWNKSAGAQDPDRIFHILDRRMFQVIRQEWVKHVESGASAGALAQVLVEWMRDPENDEARRTAVNAYAFISVRSWPEVLSALRTHESVRDPLRDLEGLDSRAAEEYFDEWKLMVTSQVGEYWDSLLSQATEGEPKEGEDSQNN